METYENSYIVCAVTLLAEPSIWCEYVSNMTKSDWYVSDNTEIDKNIWKCIYCVYPHSASRTKH